MDALINPPTEAKASGWVRRTDRRAVIPSSGDLSTPYATRFTTSRAPGLPGYRPMHRQHQQTVGEHGDAFASPVGTLRRGTLVAPAAVRDGNGRVVEHLGRHDNQRARREQARRLQRYQEAKRQTPRERAVAAAATSLVGSGLDAKRLFANFDRNKDGTISFSSFRNGMRLAGVKAPAHLERELFDRAAGPGGDRLDYARFVDDMRAKSAQALAVQTSVEIEDPAEAARELREETARAKMRGLGYLRTQRSSDGHVGSTGFGQRQKVAWRNMTPAERKQKLLREKVMLKLQAVEDKVEAAFVSVDEQRDGCLNKREFHEGLRRIGLTLSNDDAVALFNDLPHNEDGLVDYRGFAHFLRARSVAMHQAGQVRATNYTKDDSAAHIVQQRVADAVAAKRKDLAVVFRFKDQGRASASAQGSGERRRGDGMVSLADVDDALKSVGVILSAPDTERLFDRIDTENTGRVPYADFLRYTCGESAVDLPDSTEEKKRRVRHLRSWNAIGGDRTDGSLQGYTEPASAPPGRRASVVSVDNPAKKLTEKERADLVTQQRIVDLYAAKSHELEQVFAWHAGQGDPIDLPQFVRGSMLAGLQVAPADAERLFRSVDGSNTGRIDPARLVASLRQHGTRGVGGRPAYRGVPEHVDGVFAAPREPGGAAASKQDNSDDGQQPGGQWHDPRRQGAQLSARAHAWHAGDAGIRQERLAAEKLLRKIQSAAETGVNRRGQNTLARAFADVEGAREGFVSMDAFQEGISNLGLQISSSDTRKLFAHFGAQQGDALNFHSFAALVHDRNRKTANDGLGGLRFRSESLNDARVMLDAQGTPYKSKIPVNDGNRPGSGLQHARASSATQAHAMRRRLRALGPKDPHSCRQYLLHVFHKFDRAGRRGKVSRRHFQNALTQFDQDFAGKKAGMLVAALDTGYTGEIDYMKFVDSVVGVDERGGNGLAGHSEASHDEQVRRNAAITDKKQARLDWSKHRWQNFQNSWTKRYGAPAAREFKMDAATPPSGKTWSSAPSNKQPFRVVRHTAPAPRSLAGGAGARPGTR